MTPEEPPKQKLLERVRGAIRLKNYSNRTEETSVQLRAGILITKPGLTIDYQNFTPIESDAVRSRVLVGE